jgi:sortase A
VLTSEPEVETATPDPVPPPASRHRVARVVGAIGRLMMTSGVVILLLVAYQLWGTSLQTNRAQAELADEFEALVGEDVAPAPSESSESSTTTEAPTSEPEAPPETTPAEVAPSNLAPPGEGDVIGRMRVPAMGRDSWFYIIEGIDPDELRRAAGHYPGTPLPGQAGNASVAGHRTTYAAPFHDIDDLVAGDEIFFETIQGSFTYAVRDTVIVDPLDTSVIQPRNPTPENPAGENVVTLTACHPKFSAEQRIIVTAELVGNPVEKLEGQDEAAQEVLAAQDEEVASGQAIDGFATEPALTFPGAWWGLVCMLLWGLTRIGALLLRRTKVPWPLAYLVGTPVCLLVLYLFFESFSYEGFARSIGLSI